LCDRFFDSTVAYQRYGRGLDPGQVQQAIEIAVGRTRPDLTFLLRIPLEVSEARRRGRAGQAPRDRMEEADRAFFQRVGEGYDAIAAGEPHRVRVIDGTRSIEDVAAAIWGHVQSLSALRRGD
jgi:dTMP kinase